MVRPLDEDAGDFKRQPAQICRDDRLQNQIVIDIPGGQRSHRNVGVHLQHFDIQAFVFEIALELGDSAAQKRHVGIRNSDVDRFGFHPMKGKTQGPEGQQEAADHTETKSHSFTPLLSLAKIFIP